MPETAPTPNYLLEMLSHPIHLYSAMGAVTASALTSIPYGYGPAMVPLLIYGAGVAISALFIPSDPRFQESVDRREREARREARRQHLLSELEVRAGKGGAQREAYLRMRERLQSLEGLFQNKVTSLTRRDLERLDEATVAFLNNWLAWLVMQEQWRNIDEQGIQARIDKINKALKGSPGSVERRTLEKTREDLDKLLRQREALWARKTAAEAALMTMAHAFEELVQRVISNPTSGDLGAELLQTVEQMRTEDELDLKVEDEVAALLAATRATSTRSTPH